MNKDYKKYNNIYNKNGKNPTKYIHEKLAYIYLKNNKISNDNYNTYPLDDEIELMFKDVVNYSDNLENFLTKYMDSIY